MSIVYDIYTYTSDSDTFLVCCKEGSKTVELISHPVGGSIYTIIMMPLSYLKLYKRIDGIDTDKLELLIPNVIESDLELFIQGTNFESKHVSFVGDDIGVISTYLTNLFTKQCNKQKLISNS